MFDLIISIDVGTTSTGIAVCVPAQKPEVLQWGSSEATKVPTVLLYNADKNLRSWGFEAADRKSEQKTILQEWFKLGLGNKNYSPQEVKRCYIDYLRQLYHELSVTRLPDLATGRLNQRSWSSLRIRFLFSIPATWDQKETELFDGFILDSGFGTYDSHSHEVLVTEPQAAIVSEFHNLQDDLRHHRPYNFLVVDAGGGTADFCLAEVIRKDGGPRIVERVPVVGANIGATDIDRAFEGLVRSILVEDEHLLRCSLDDAAFLARNSQEFHDAKHSLAAITNPQNAFFIKVPGLEDSSRRDSRIKDGAIFFTEFVALFIELHPVTHLGSSDDLKPFFDEQVAQIVDKVAECLQRGQTSGFHLDFLVLCGGLGGSSYVKSKIRQLVELPDCGLNGTTLVEADSPRLSVCKGLALYAGKYPNAFPLPLARMSLGLVQPVPWETWLKSVNGSPHNSDLDPSGETPTESTTVTRDQYGVAWVNRIQWFIRKGDPIPRSKKIEQEYKIFLDSETVAAERACSLRVVASSSANPSTSLDHEISNFPLTLEIDFTNSKKGQKTVTSWLNKVFRQRHYVEVCLKVTIELNLAMATFHCTTRSGKRLLQLPQELNTKTLTEWGASHGGSEDEDVSAVSFAFQRQSL